MNWNQLQYVITIAEEKSITKAAQKLYISQPSLSLSIQALEKETGIPLFERNRGEMKLTYAGSLFGTAQAGLVDDRCCYQPVQPR